MTRVCKHLVDDSEGSYSLRFTGRGVDHVLVCEPCQQAPLDELLATSGDDPEAHQRGLFSVEQVIGSPEVLSRPTAMRFEHREVAVPALGPERLRVLSAYPDPSRSLWLAVNEQGELLRVDAGTRSAERLAMLPTSTLDLTAPLALDASPCGRFASLVNRRGQHGLVVDLVTGGVTMRLDRGDYHEDVQDFSIAFFRDGDRTLLVHATAWNRLDISDPHTGSLLTAREGTNWEKDQPRPEHYLDYFHGGLVVSPDQRWLVDDGWVWHPVGVLQALDLQRWLRENPHESEDGPSVVTLRQAAYFWDASRCFVSDRVVAVGGFGADDELMIDGALLIDAPTGKLDRWFAGPPRQGTFVFDRWLFSFADGHGTSVWDIATGERLHHQPDFVPAAYHHGARCFLSLADGPTLRESRLIAD